MSGATERLSWCISLLIENITTDGIIVNQINPKLSYKQGWTNSVNSDQMPRNAASDQRLHCLSLIQQFVDSLESYKMELLKL